MIKKLTKDTYKTTSWSGGKTDEIYTFPELATLEDDNYDYRISLATVEVEEASFTTLPEIERTLTVLEGDHSLSLNDKGFVSVPPYNPVTFSGADKTQSKGKSLNFNFMKRTDLPHEVNVMQADQTERIVLLPNHNRSLLFVIDGKVETNQGDLNKHDSLFFDEEIMVILNAKTLFIKVDF
jgi:environmental stress-induced protein Ves